jgi:gliding motility-associated-like protein
LQSFNWNFGDAIGTSIIENPLYAYNTEGSYNVSLIVTSNEGCIDSVTNPITVFPLPIVSFTQIDICDDVAMSFTNTSSIPSGAITSYNWNFGDGVGVSTLTSPTYTFPTDGNYTVTLVATSNNGCVDSVSTPVTVFPLPEPSFTQVDVCDGAQMNFTNTSIISSGTITGYNWNFGQPLATSTATNPVYTYTTNGTFTVILVATSDEGCVFSTSDQVVVSPTPTAGFTANNVCLQTAAFMQSTANANGGAIALTQWDYTSNGSIDFTGTDATFIYPTAGPFTITQIVSTLQGCADTVSQNITIHPLPVVQFTAQNVCEGNTVSFTNTSGIASGNISSYFWDFGNGNTSTQVSPTDLYAFEGVFNVVLTATSNNNCSSQLTQPVEIYPLPEPQFLLANICEEESASFTSISIVSNQNTTNSINSLVWNFGVLPTATGSGQFANHTYPDAGTFTVTLTATTNRGCIAAVQNTITVNPKPSISFISINNQGCSELCVNFTNNSSVATGSIDEWFWNFGDGNLSQLANASNCYSNELPQDIFFTVSLTGITDQGCQNTLIQPNFVTVFGQPVADFEADKYITSLYQTDINFTNTSLLSESYDWNFYDMDSSVLENPSHIFPFGDSGIYTVCLNIASINGCLDSICKDITITGAPNLYIPNSFTPNGDGDNEFFVPYISGLLEREFTFMIFDRWGTKIYESTSPTGISWDGTYQGTPAPIDTYTWRIKGLNQYDLSEINKIGHINLIR